MIGDPFGLERFTVVTVDVGIHRNAGFGILMCLAIWLVKLTSTEIFFLALAQYFSYFFHVERSDVFDVEKVGLDAFGGEHLGCFFHRAP